MKRAFNRFIPLMSLVMNHRDHRKIMVIDGHTGFTGGINIADEYINHVIIFGHWKDSGIKIKGEAVWSLTAMFLQMWNAFRDKDEPYEKYMPYRYFDGEFEDDGYVQPYGDTPLDDENVSENIYLNIINNATDYVYIGTPYLIIDNEMITALSLAAKRGVDVRMVVPHIYDKKYIGWLSQSYHVQLIERGVKIYSYIPGFIHDKCFLCDDELASVGTANMDYRSLYLHFECGTLLYKSTAVMDIKEDFMEMFVLSEEVTKESAVKRLPIRLAQSILRCLAPLF